MIAKCCDRRDEPARIKVLEHEISVLCPNAGEKRHRVSGLIRLAQMRDEEAVEFANLRQAHELFVQF